MSEPQIRPKKEVRPRIVNEWAWLDKLVYSGREYESYERGLVYWKDRVYASALCDFTARIVEDLVMDDGVETTRAYRLEAALNRGRRVEQITVTASQFSAMTWVDELLGADATIYPNCRDHVRAAIKRLSTQKIRRTVFRHTGWRILNGKAIYLHAAGAIGAKGAVKGIDTELSPALRNYVLPDPPHGAELIEAVKASLRMLDLAPDRITFPVYSAIWRAKLQECDLSVFAAGRTQSGKSELTALAQQHDGAAMTRKKLPASFLSTGNSIEMLGFEAKDALLTIDDFNPTGTAAEQQKMHALAERIFRAQGNLSARNRLTSDITLRPGKPPRGMYLSSGEQIPRGHSLRARLVVVEVARGDIQRRVLDECQRDARNGVYAKATAAFVQWLAPRIQESERMLLAEMTALRQAADDGSNILRRSPDNIYQLAASFKIFLSFAVQRRAIEKDAAAALWTRACTAFSEVIHGQQTQQEAADPARQFFELLLGILQAGHGHLASTAGAPPENPTEWGWRPAESGEGWRPSGERLGWIDKEGVYLKPRPTYNAVRRFAIESGEYPPLPCDTLWLRLQQGKMLASSGEKSRGTKFTVRHYCEGARPDVLHVYQETLLLLTDPTDPTDPAKSAWSGFKTVLRRTDPRPDPLTDPNLTTAGLTESATSDTTGQLGQLGQSLVQESKALESGAGSSKSKSSRNGHKAAGKLTHSLTRLLTQAGFSSRQAFDRWYDDLYASHPTRGSLEEGRLLIAEQVLNGTLTRKVFDVGYQAHRLSEKWTREGGRFIPKLSTFVKDRGWQFPPVEPTRAEQNGGKGHATSSHTPTAAERRAKRLRNL